MAAMKKRLFMMVLLVVGISLDLNSPSTSWAQAKGPIKIGFIAPFTGPLLHRERHVNGPPAVF